MTKSEDTLNVFAPLSFSISFLAFTEAHSKSIIRTTGNFGLIIFRLRLKHPLSQLVSILQASCWYLADSRKNKVPRKKKSENNPYVTGKIKSILAHVSQSMFKVDLRLPRQGWRCLRSTDSCWICVLFTFCFSSLTTCKTKSVNQGPHPGINRLYLKKKKEVEVYLGGVGSWRLWPKCIVWHSQIVNKTIFSLCHGLCRHMRHWTESLVSMV